MDKACGNARPIPQTIIDRAKKELNLNTDLIFTIGGEIDLLLEMEKPKIHQQLRMYVNEEDDLCIMETQLGLLVVGPSTNHPNGFHECSAARVTSFAKNFYIWKFLTAEIVGVKKDCVCQTKTDEEIRYRNIMQTNWSRTDSG